MSDRRSPVPGGGVQGLRALLRDPPRADRIRWREGIFPTTLISDDRGLMARTFGTLYWVGGSVGLATLAFDCHLAGDPDRALDGIAPAQLFLGLCFGQKFKA